MIVRNPKRKKTKTHDTADKEPSIRGGKRQTQEKRKEEHTEGKKAKDGKNEHPARSFLQLTLSHQSKKGKRVSVFRQRIPLEKRGKKNELGKKE